jgi:hypothetical protein
MKSFWPLFSLVAMLSLLPPAKGDDVITNIMSPIASYQYPEDVASQALTNGGILSPEISYQFPEDLSVQALVTGGILSPVTSYQYPEDINTQLLINGGFMSPIASYQYFEWPGNDVLNLQNSPVVSYFWQQGGDSSVTSYLHGWVTDAKGAALSGATVSANVLLTTSIQATTDNSGYYQMPTVSGGVYDLCATKVGYQTSVRALTLNSGTVQQDFLLQPLPPTSDRVPVNRTPTVPYTVGNLMGSKLLIYNGTSFVPITTNNWPKNNLMTIVMTHGWNSDPTVWAEEMSAKMVANRISANIVAWDWHAAATGGLTTVDPGVAADRTPDQGVALGEALQYYLGGDYTLPLHFLGHSLGTLVNASAIDFVHGEKPGVTPQVVWNSNLIHVTLFDQALLAETLGVGVIQAPLPLHFNLADNYESLVDGYSLPLAVNVVLQKGLLVAVVDNPLQILTDAHRYPIEWYEMSILTPTDVNSTLGFKWSYEYALSSFSPSTYPPGSVYHQSLQNADELALEPMPLILQPFGALGDNVVQTLRDVAQYVGNVELRTADTTASWEVGLFNYAWNAAAQRQQALVNNFNSAFSLGVSLTTGPYTAIPHLNNGLPRPSAVPYIADSTTDISNTPAMVWLPIQFPVNAMAMTFDFALFGDPASDVLVCGIGTNTLFSISAKYIPTNQFSASRLIDVSAWAGVTNELFFGFLGGTSTNATLQIQNIQFYSLQPPKLNIIPLTSATILTWPTTAAGYTIESTPSLAFPLWETATNIPVITGNNYILTNYWSDQTRFFRLRKQ